MQESDFFFMFPNLIRYYPSVGTLTAKDDVLLINTYNVDIGNPDSNFLYLTPLEVNVKQNIDTTPVTITGIVSSAFNFSAVVVGIVCNNIEIEVFNAYGVLVTSLGELVTLLNDSTKESSFLGVFREDGAGGLLLDMPVNLVERFNPYGSTLTFDVYSD
jgi:hypothetical protein